MLELIPMRPFLPGFRANPREFFPRPQVISIPARRLNCPLPARSYHPPCANNFQQEFRTDVSNRELMLKRIRTESAAEVASAVQESTVRPFLVRVRAGIPYWIEKIVTPKESGKAATVLASPPSVSPKWPILGRATGVLCKNDCPLSIV